MHEYIKNVEQEREFQEKQASGYVLMVKEKNVHIYVHVYTQILYST